MILSGLMLQFSGGGSIVFSLTRMTFAHVPLSLLLRLRGYPGHAPLMVMVEVLEGENHLKPRLRIVTPLLPPSL